ncbi:MAG: hypothetical protein FJ320_08700 [SAR202 cluster bacterium]|nr:hypothetical protein [SAR202 cluster bacterium]
MQFGWVGRQTKLTSQKDKVMGAVAHTGLISKRLGLIGALLALAALLFVILGPASNSAPATEAAAGEVLILDPAGFDGGFGTSRLAMHFTNAGKTPVIVDNATWATMTTAQFA